MSTVQVGLLLLSPEKHLSAFPLRCRAQRPNHFPQSGRLRCKRDQKTPSKKPPIALQTSHPGLVFAPAGGRDRQTQSQPGLVVLPSGVNSGHRNTAEQVHDLLFPCPLSDFERKQPTLCLHTHGVEILPALGNSPLAIETVHIETCPCHSLTCGGRTAIRP
jgi:hypothetical protein